MKLNIYLLLSLGQLATASPNLDVRDVETECYSFDAVDDERMLDFNTYAACSEECGPLGKFVIAMRGSACFCLESLPADDKKVDASKCDEPCPGYVLYTCGGGRDYYSVATIDESDFDSSNTTNTTSTSSATASSTSSATAIASSSDVPSNGTSSVTPSSSSASPSSSSASGSSASESATVESSGAAAFGLGSMSTVVSASVYAVAALFALLI